MSGIVEYLLGSHWLTANLWSITFGSLFTIGMILIIRLLFGRFLSVKTKYYLWILLMIRLCVADLPESNFSIMNLEPVRNNNYQEMILYAQEDHSDVIVASDGRIQLITELKEAKAALPSPLLIWFLGVLTLILYYSSASILSKQRLKRAIDVEDPDTLHTLVLVRGQLGITRDIRLCYGSQTLIGGLIRPTMMIPRELTGEKLEAALTHELMHYRCGDLWIIAIQRILCAIHWFNPLVLLCFAWARRDCEKACDERVLQMNVSPEVYADLLYEEGKMKRTIQPGTTAFGRSNLKYRIKRVMKFKAPARWMVIPAVIFSILIFITTLTGGVEKKPPAPELDTYHFFLNTDSHSLVFSEPGQQYVVKYSIKPPNSEIRWSVDDEAVAVVDEYGVVTAVGPGVCTLTAVSGDYTLHETITCEFSVDVTDTCSERDMLAYFFTIPDEKMFQAFSEKAVTDSNDAIKAVLEQKFSGRYSMQFELSFLAGNNIGKLWRYAYDHGFSVQMNGLSITKGMSSGYDYAANLTILFSDGRTQNLNVYGELNFDYMGRINTMTLSGQEIRDFYAKFED